MNWNHLTIGKKIALGFGVTLALLGVVGCLSYFGVGGIVRNAGEVIDGNKLAGMQEARDVYAQKTLPALERVRTLLGNIRQEARKHIMTDEIMLQSARGTRRNVLLVGGLAVLVGIGLAFLISRSIIIALKEIFSQMEEGADQVSSAAGQVSSASQSLAEGASEQAASIEETSSSLEEMSSMTRQNADNATQADPLMKEANQVVHSANTSMDELTQSMEEISKASEETSKIIKTIDEIAFQTNLLALNAAVEAARAGEQAQGITQVNTAVTEVDKVTQQNAANAEESASAAEEMNAQAVQMKAIVADLMTLVGGTGTGNTAGTNPKVGKIKEVLHLTQKKFDKGKTEARGFKTPMNPEKVIPLEQEDFRDF